MQWRKLMSSTGCAFRMSDELSSAAGARPDILVFDCGFPEPSGT